MQFFLKCTKLHPVFFFQANPLATRGKKNPPPPPLPNFLPHTQVQKNSHSEARGEGEKIIHKMFQRKVKTKMILRRIFFCVCTNLCVAVTATLPSQEEQEVNNKKKNYQSQVKGKVAKVQQLQWRNEKKKKRENFCRQVIRQYFQPINLTVISVSHLPTFGHVPHTLLGTPGVPNPLFLGGGGGEAPLAPK